jgi:acetamidase/formamidase
MHRLQGDGEVGCLGLETWLRGTVQIILHKGKELKWPRAETPTHFITMGLDRDLDEAVRIATREMIAYLMTEKGFTWADAMTLSSLAVDLRVTQIVDGVKGIHAMLPKAIFAR